MSTQSADLFILNVTELRKSALVKLAVAWGVIAYVWLITMVASTDTTIPLAAWIGGLVLALGSSLSYVLRVRYPTWAGIALISAVHAAVTLALDAVPSVHLAYLFVVTATMASVLLGLRGLLAAALAALASLAWVGLTHAAWSLERSQLAIPSAVIILTSLAAWLSAGNLSVALDWTWSAYEIARRHERALQLRRADLRRTLNALEEATARLDRTNRELLVARKHAEEARALQEQFVANVSHELRTPLNLVVGFAELLYLSPESYEGVGWTPDLLGDIGAMYRAGKQLQSLIDDVLDLSRINAARLPMFREQSDIGAIIRDAMATMGPLLDQRGLSASQRIPDGLPQLFVDRTRIRQVLINLLNNALRFTDRGEISVAVVEQSDALVISVSDTGIGIPANQLEQIFEEFRQVDASLRRRGGAGLGLAISRQFVELHGGRMWAESVEGEGSVLHFSLPLVGREVAPSALMRTRDRRHADLSSLPVVVVDPDPTMGQMLKRYLGDHEVVSVQTPAQADSCIDQVHPLAVIVNEPPGTAADEWLASTGASAVRWSVPVLHCAIPSPSWLTTTSGIRDCLTKPITRETLVAAVSRFGEGPFDVLVVDDDPGFVSLIGRMLQGTGLVDRMVTAYGGAEAVDLARAESPDVVLLDLLMPDVDGFEVLDRLRETGDLDGLKVIAVTATSYAEEALQRREGIFTIVQSKGFMAGQLTELLRAGLANIVPEYARVENLDQES